MSREAGTGVEGMTNGATSLLGLCFEHLSPGLPPTLFLGMGLFPDLLTPNPPNKGP